MASRIRGLGQVALRVADLDRMQAFYQDTIGLELLRRFERAAFFRLAEGFGGHVQVLALFDRSSDPGFTALNPAATTVDHLAFEIELADFEGERRRLADCGLVVTTAEHGWVHWRSIYVVDPEGNTVELVCYDPSVVDHAACASESRKRRVRFAMRIVKTVSRYVFAIFFIGAGILHFRNPDFYLKIMPPYIPWHLAMVDISGVAEIVLGGMLLFSKLQRLAGWGLILLLVAIFPANIYVYQHQELFPGIPPIAHLLRLPLQAVFILWAYWYTRPDRPLGAPVQPATASQR
jgi:uncharacterized membrane protein/catechol 2,3-dioxygenase-like lactoylglutathione lyase family enzyme